MQNKILKLIFSFFILVISGNLFAQTGKDTVYLYNVEGKWSTKDSLIKRMHLKKVKMDSTQARLFKEARTKTYRKNLDSFHYKKIDSMHFAFKKLKLDSVRMKMHYKVKLDSVHFKNSRLFTKHKLDSFRFKKLDSMHIKFKKIRLDSFISRKPDCDTARIKLKMEKLNRQLENLKEQLKDRRKDSARMGDVKRTVSLQLACNSDVKVEIKDVDADVNIKHSSGDNIRVVAVVSVSQAQGMDNEAVLKKMGIEISGSKENLKIARPAGRAVAARYGSRDGRNNSLTVYVPQNSNINIENKSRNVTIEKNMKEVEVSLSNGNLSMKNAERAVIKSSNGSVRAGVIKDADIELSGSRLTCEAIEKLKIDSRYSNVSFTRTAALAFKSVSDKYDIQQAGEVKGDKSFGEFKISNLKNSFVLTGSGADIKINNIELEVGLVKIDNKYADIKLPVTKLSNYSVDFGGARTNVSAPFEKKYLTAIASNTNLNAANNFSAAVGDVNSGHTRFQINCSSCIVDFN